MVKRINYGDWERIKRRLHFQDLSVSEISLLIGPVVTVALLLSLKIGGVISERLFCLCALALLSLASWRHSREQKD